MKVAALISGGKDSIYAIYIALQYGWDVTYLVNLIPSNKNSWIFHSINLQVVPAIADSLGIPLITKHTNGEKERELDDLEAALKNLPVEGIISGAVASDYQRTRINHVCDSLNLKSFTPLWHKNPEQLLRWQVNAGFRLIIVSVSAEGLGREWLGKEINERSIDGFIEHCRKHRIHVAGEGGEFETLVIDCPIYKKRLIIEDAETIWSRDYGHLVIKSVDSKLK
ncbi:MAG TPA: TIGR00289 family protein [Thermoplasmatales archaeon]|nr:TIGR00289 family protein [Thermoplasmatales archaeon]